MKMNTMSHLLLFDVIEGRLQLERSDKPRDVIIRRTLKQAQYGGASTPEQT